jgi:hypothetical protein
MHFPTLRAYQAEDGTIAARIFPLENEGEPLARKQTLDSIEKSETRGMEVLLHKLCDASQVVSMNSAGSGIYAHWMTFSLLGLSCPIHRSSHTPGCERTCPVLRQLFPNYR